MNATPIKIAILAMGGEGGGVLADWIVDLAEHNGHVAQTTSVPGVAQRTGATIYYVELFPAPAAGTDVPVLALMPLPGDVDIVLASELMEAARAVQRGLVTPDRTTLVCSTHRVYAIGERIALGDGRVDAASLLAHAQGAARRFTGFDMAQLAEDNGSVISAVLFGALAAAQVLPFSRAQFEATIERGGIGTRTSLAGFAAGFGGPRLVAPVPAATPEVAPRSARGRVLLERIERNHPAAARGLLVEGVRRLVDYQDFDYAGLYLDRIERTLAQPHADALHAELARFLALWMSYEDTIRVADLKTRDTRLARVRNEVHAEETQPVSIEEYLHPRVEEVCDTLPAALGAWILRTDSVRGVLARWTSRGRVVRTNSLRGFLLLSAIAGMRRWRRSTLRYQVENARIEAWLRDLAQAASPALALEIVRCQRLVKGYGDTHARGWRNFERIRAAWQRGGRDMAPATLHALVEAALADEEGKRLDEALARYTPG